LGNDGLWRIRAGNDPQAGSLLENHFLVDPSVGTVLVDVRAVAANRHRQYGRASGEGEGDGHEGDELSHGGLLCPRLRRGSLQLAEFNTVTLGTPAKIEREAAHGGSILFHATWNDDHAFGPSACTAGVAHK
jgi:hypothetical protein